MSEVQRGFVSDPVTVEVPATSANLGPGFDSFGLALDLVDTLTAEVTGPDIGSGLEVTVEGEGADSVPRDGRHLVVRAMTAAFEQMGETPPGLRLHCANRIPHSRGMGSSSAAIVGGIRLAVALVGDESARLDDDRMLQLADRLEGHPDNVAPALFGGFVIAGHVVGVEPRRVWTVVRSVHPDITPVSFVPAHDLNTLVARGLLPSDVSHHDAAANAARAGVLSLALTSDPDLLMVGTEDFLHQEAREPAMPDSLALVHRLREAGIPAVVSGAGPSVLALVGPQRPGKSSYDAAAVADMAPSGWRGEVRRVSSHGVRVCDAAATAASPRPEG